MTTIIVTFYRYNRNDEPCKVVLDTHTSDWQEAYKVAIANGHNPQKMIRYTFVNVEG